MLMQRFNFLQAMLLTLLVSMLPIGKATAQEAYAHCDNNGTLTFYYDTERNTREGTTYDLNDDIKVVENDGYEDYADPGWLKASFTAVVFDPSFADARPTSTYRWFSGRIGLTSITGLTYLNTSEVTVMSFMFDNCYYYCPLNIDILSHICA